MLSSDRMAVSNTTTESTWNTDKSYLVIKIVISELTSPCRIEEKFS